MFYCPATSMFRIFNEINHFKEIQNGGSKMEDPRWRLSQYKIRHSDAIIVANDNKHVIRHKNLIGHNNGKTLLLYIE